MDGSIFKCSLCKLLRNTEAQIEKHIVKEHGNLINPSVIGDYYSEVGL